MTKTEEYTGVICSCAIAKDGDKNGRAFVYVPTSEAEMVIVDHRLVVFATAVDQEVLHTSRSFDYINMPTEDIRLPEDILLSDWKPLVLCQIQTVKKILGTEDLQ